MSKIRVTYPLSPHLQLEIAQGDLTQEPLDAIVNAANARLMHGGGVAMAILQAGGWSIQLESNAWIRQHGPVSNTEPAYTHAGKLPTRYIIHAVGPIWGEGDEDNKLALAIAGSLKRAEALKLHSIAFPAISTGIFGFPKERAAKIFFATFQAYASQHVETSLSLIRVTLWDEDSLQIFLDAAQQLLETR